jgi:hypothetical protein
MLYNEMAETITLDGPWEFSLGGEEPWQTIEVPGCWEAQGYSRFNEGPAYYQRQVNIPSDWDGRRVIAEFDAVSFACKVRINSMETGEHYGLWTPFALDITRSIHFGEQNLIELEIYKPGVKFPMRSCLAGFIPDVATPFGGIWQPARLRALGGGIEDFSVRSDYASGRIKIEGKAEMFERTSDKAEWEITVLQGDRLISNQRSPVSEDRWLEIDLQIPNPEPWSPDRPALYSIDLNLLEHGNPISTASRRTGFRRLWADGNRLMLNDRPFMVRGILSWGWEPERIAPSYTKEQAMAELRRVRKMGFNTIKLCLFVPNQAYFDAADEEGMLLWQEWPLWLPLVTSELRARAPGEYQELSRLTQPHPSVALYSLGCELDRSVDANLLGQLNRAVRDQVSDVLVCDNSGSGESYGGLEFDLADFSDYHPYYDLHYFEPLLDNWRRDWQKPRPWIFGEFCDSDTFRNLDEMEQAHAGQPPWWMTADNPVTTWRPEAQAVLQARERLAKSDPGFSCAELVSISHAQSWVVRKYTLEALRRRSGMGGYIVTGLRDTPISTSGIWDDFARPKWDPETFRQINGAAVLCLDVGRRRRWRFGGDRPERLDAHNFWSGEPARWHVILHHSSSDFPQGSELDWSLEAARGAQIASGSARLSQPLSAGRPQEAGVIEWVLPEVQRAEVLALKVKLTGVSGTVSNRWPIWVYPALSPPPDDLGLLDPSHQLTEAGDWLASAQRGSRTEDLLALPLVLATAWDENLPAYIQRGGRVLSLQQGNGPLPAVRRPFWREGITLFSEHPLWKVFPQGGHADLQFFGLAGDTAFDTPRLIQAFQGLESFRPILRRLDARQLLMGEYLFESRIGEGLLLGCSLRLQGGAGSQPYGWERNPAGAFMLSQLLSYLKHA